MNSTSAPTVVAPELGGVPSPHSTGGFLPARRTVNRKELETIVDKMISPLARYSNPELENIIAGLHYRDIGSDIEELLQNILDYRRGELRQ